MVDKVGSGTPSSAPPQTTSTDKVDSAKASDTQPTTTQAPKDSSPPPAATEQKGQTQKFSEFALSGMARAAQFTNFTGPEPPKLPTEELLKRNDNQKEPKPEVQELQKQVNQWRTENGKKPIKEDGYFGEKTEKAVYEFQKANGLQKDGQAGIQTQNRVLMENDSNFKQLDPSIKDQTRKSMSDYGKDSAKVENLRNFATSPGLGKLSTAHQQQMLDIQKASPDDTKLTSQLGTLANDATFQKLNDTTKTEVLNQVKGYAGDPGKIDNLTKLTTSPGFEQLSNDHQKKMMDALKTRPDDAQLAEGLGKMASSPGFRNSNDKVKDSVIDTISKNPPATPEKVDGTLNLIGSPGFTKLTDANKALITDGLSGAKADPAYAANVQKLVADPKFDALKPEEKTAVLSQVKNYPDAKAVENYQKLIQKDWFKDQDLGDKQRSLKLVGRLSTHTGGDQTVLNNTLEKLVGPGSDYKLVWKDYTSTDGSITYGEAIDKTLWLNKGLAAADNNKLAETPNTNHMALSTAPHEINHLRNGDKPDKTYKYFEAEYRAWYVGFKAEFGRPPTNAEAQSRISYQLDPNTFYGKYAKKALKDDDEAKQFYAFVKNMTGKNVDGSNIQTVINSNTSTWTNPNDPAPIPGGNIDNH